MTLLGITLLLLTIIITVLWYGTEPDSKADIALSLLGMAMGTVGLTLILI